VNRCCDTEKFKLVNSAFVDKLNPWCGTLSLGGITVRLQGIWTSNVSLALLLGATSTNLLASEMATATYTVKQLSPSSFEYDLTLDDTGTTDIGTFWFSWIPGEGFLGTLPTSVSDPAGWTDMITNGGLMDGFAIQWVAGPGAALLPGQSLSGYKFDSALTPAQLAGDSPFHPGSRESTFFVYSGAPFSDAGSQGVAQQAATVPEPSSVALSAVAIAFAIRGRKLLARV